MLQLKTPPPILLLKEGKSKDLQVSMDYIETCNKAMKVYIAAADFILAVVKLYEVLEEITET